MVRLASVKRLTRGSSPTISTTTIPAVSAITGESPE